MIALIFFAWIFTVLHAPVWIWIIWTAVFIYKLFIYAVALFNRL